MQEKNQKNGWYYWGKNQHSHYIVFRNPNDRYLVASGIIRILPGGLYKYRIEDNKTLQEDTTDSMDAAKQMIEQVVNKIISEQFAEEYIPPLG